MGLRILHTADCHVGMRLDRYGAEAEVLAQARVDVIDRLVDVANDERCDLFVIAGDLFHRVSVAKPIVAEVMGKLRRFNGRAILILPGNHDYLEERSGLWDRVESELPEHAVVLKEQKPLSLGRFDLPGVAVYPGPCATQTSSENAVDWIPGDIAGDEISIGVAHGSLEGVSPDFTGAYYPMTRTHLLGKGGIDLWLLGHTHVPHPESAGGQIYYAGTPEPDGMDCRHGGSCWVIEVDEGGRLSADLHHPGTYRFEDRREKVEDGAALQRLIDEYEGRRHTVLRLKVEGWIPREDHDHYIRSGENRLYRGISDSVAHLLNLDLSDLHPQIDQEVIDREFSRGSFPHRLMQEVADHGDRRALQLAYELIREVKEDETG